MDVVIASRDSDTDDILVEESGVSDHRFVCWTTPAANPPPEFKRMKWRNWKHFALDQFISRLRGSGLGFPVDPRKTTSELAEHY